MNDILIEIHRTKEIITNINELEGIIKILKISDVIKNNMLERIKEIKGILKEAKLHTPEKYRLDMGEE